MPGPLELLLRAKRAALEAQGFVPDAGVWFHGTNKDVVPANRPLWLAEPDVAFGYTGGGRRGGAGTPAKGGRLYPFVLRSEPRDTGLTATKPLSNPGDDEVDWLLDRLGIKAPRDFRGRVAERAQSMATNQPYMGSFVPAWDDLGYIGGVSKAYRVPPRFSTKVYELFDRPAFLDTLIEELGPEALFKLDHPSTRIELTPKGKIRYTPETVHAPVIVAPRPEASLRSPWEFARGGLAALR